MPQPADCTPPHLLVCVWAQARHKHGQLLGGGGPSRGWAPGGRSVPVNIRSRRQEQGKRGLQHKVQQGAARESQAGVCHDAMITMAPIFRGASVPQQRRTFTGKDSTPDATCLPAARQAVGGAHLGPPCLSRLSRLRERSRRYSRLRDLSTTTITTTTAAAPSQHSMAGSMFSTNRGTTQIQQTNMPVHQRAAHTSNQSHHHQPVITNNPMMTSCAPPLPPVPRAAPAPVPPVPVAVPVAPVPDQHKGQTHRQQPIRKQVTKIG
jgi:hypothetical protein